MEMEKKMIVVTEKEKKKEENNIQRVINSHYQLPQHYLEISSFIHSTSMPTTHHISRLPSISNRSLPQKEMA